MKTFFSILLGLLVFSAGCEPSCEKLAEGEPSIEIGSGASEFESILDGDVLRPDWGMQGGQHFWSSLRVSGVHRGTAIGSDPTSLESRPDIRFTVSFGDEQLAEYDRPSVQLKHLPDGSGELIGATSFIGFSPYQTPQFFPEDFDPEGWESWEEGEVEAAWAYATDLAESMDWTFTVTLTDSCGTEVSDSRTVRVEGLEDGGY